MSHSDSCFITLTYAEENLPYTLDGQKTLCKRDIQLFMKRLRKYYDSKNNKNPKEIRYYFCGEYGSKHKRPHYHAIIFGALLDVDTLSRLWPHGLVHVGTCTADSIQYVAGYVLKKFVNKKQDTITPEFTLMSRRPGIGFYALDSYHNLSDNPYFNEFITQNNDLPSSLTFGTKSYPLDRYLKSKISDALNIDSDKQYLNFVQRTLDRQQEALKQGKTLADYELDIDKTRRRTRETLTKIYSKRNDL